MNWFRWKGEGYFHVQAPTSIGEATTLAGCGDSGPTGDTEDWRSGSEIPTPTCKWCLGWALHYGRLQLALSGPYSGVPDA